MVSALLALVLISGVQDSAVIPSGLALTMNGVLKVEDPEATLKTLVAAADSLDGYFARASKNSLELRIPTSKAQTFWQTLPKYGLVVEQNQRSENLSSELVDLQARLAARQKTMNQYMTLLETANDTAVFQIEEAISILQEDVDATQGQIHRDLDRVYFARLTVNFFFHDRTAPLPTGTTRFAWINALGLQSLLNRMDFARPGHE